MICVPGACIKCGCPIHLQNIAGPNYEEIVFRMSDGSQMNVGICKNCIVFDEEFTEVMKALNDCWRSQGSQPSGAVIIGVGHRLKYADILRRCQGGRCLACHEPIQDKWVITHGFMLHEGCNLPGEGRGEMRGAIV